MLPSLAQDLVRFVSELRSGGIREVHIMAHSMGCELVTAALPHFEAASCPLSGVARPRGGAKRDDSAETLQISSISFCNPSCPSETFFGEDGSLSTMMRICGRLTLYSDREDTALRFA